MHLAPRRSWRSALLLKGMTWARRLAAETPLERWRVTGAVREWMFRHATSEDDAVASFRGRELIVPTCDIAMAPGLLAGYYEATELEVFERLVRDARLVVDVGANIGVYVVSAGPLLAPGGKVIAFEPAEENLTYLHRNIARNGLANCAQVEACAVSATTGSLTLYVDPAAPGQHSVSRRTNAAAAEPVVVSAVTLDDALLADETPVDVIKIDVEGAEHSVLRGARRVLERDRPAMLIEYFPEMLRSCGTEPEDLLTTIFELYAEVYSVDDLRGKVSRVQLVDLTRDEPTRLNLLAVSRPEHHDRIRPLLQGEQLRSRD